MQDGRSIVTPMRYDSQFPMAPRILHIGESGTMTEVGLNAPKHRYTLLLLQHLSSGQGSPRCSATLGQQKE